MVWLGRGHARHPSAGGPLVTDPGLPIWQAPDSAEELLALWQSTPAPDSKPAKPKPPSLPPCNPRNLKDSHRFDRQNICFNCGWPKDELIKRSQEEKEQ